MVTHLTILTQRMLATKSFVRNGGGAITQQPVTLGKYFSVECREIETIYDLAATLTRLSNSPNQFVIRGEPIPGIDIRRRIRRLKYDQDNSPATFRSSKRGESWICFDFDKIECPAWLNADENGTKAIKYLADLLPNEFDGVTFWAQWSGSSGIDGWRTLSAHLWFMLDRSVNDDHLRIWANERHLPIDASLFNAVQPHFTAAPLFSFDIPDPCRTRNLLVKGTHDVVTINLAKANVGGGVKTNSRNSQSNSKRTRPSARIEGTISGSSDSEMGSWRRENQRPCFGSTSLHAERRNQAIIDFLS